VQRVALRASGHPAKYLRADHAVSLLGFTVSTPLVRAALNRLAGVLPNGTELRYPGDGVTWALFANGSVPHACKEMTSVL